MTKYRKLLLLLLLILSFMPVHIAFADTGPKPTMEFEFNQELPDGEVTIIAGILYECKQSDCSDAVPLQELGPQRFVCETLSCRALAYGFSPYHKLEIQFSDGKTRQSNIFETEGFDSKYTVTVRPDDLLVEAQFSPMTILHPIFRLIIACLCALAGIGLVIGLVVFVIWRFTTK
jgi:hypothetical protein